MNRRDFMSAVALAPLVRAAGSPRVNGARLRSHLEKLSEFGRPAGGAFADGVSRVAYSDADVAARRYAMGLMETAGLKARKRAAPAPRQGKLLEPLTTAEIRVLEKLSERLTYAEIASELYLSLNTVKTHLRHAYMKLGATSRSSAVKRATSLGIL